MSNDIPDYMPGELSIGNRGGLEERSNLQHSLYTALQAALHEFAGKRRITTLEAFGALQMLAQEVYSNASADLGEDDEGEEWKEQEEA